MGAGAVGHVTSALLPRWLLTSSKRAALPFQLFGWVAMVLLVRDPAASRARPLLLPDGGGLVRDLLRLRCRAQVGWGPRRGAAPPFSPGGGGGGDVASVGKVPLRGVLGGVILSLTPTPRPTWLLLFLGGGGLVPCYRIRRGRGQCQTCLACVAGWVPARATRPFVTGA